MANGRTESLFGHLRPDEVNSLIARLQDIVAVIKIDAMQMKEFGQALEQLGLPVKALPIRFPLPEIAKRLRNHLVELPVAALLTASFTKRHEGSADYDRLLGWTAVAALVLLERSGDHWSKVDTACDAVRLISKQREEHVLDRFVGKTALAQDILEAATEQPVADLFNTGPDRFDPIRVLFSAYLKREIPITRSRYLLEHLETYYITTTAPVHGSELDEEAGGLVEAGQTVAYLTSHGDKNNPEHARHRVFVDIPALGPTALSSNRPYQNMRRASAAQHIIKRKMGLPCAYGTMTDFELGEIIRKCFLDCDQKYDRDWREKTLIITSLITGRSPVELVTMPRGRKRPKGRVSQWLEIDDHEITLCFDALLTEPKLTNDMQRLLDSQTTAPFRLKIPPSVSWPLCDFFEELERKPFDETKLAKVFNSLRPKGSRRQTLHRVQSALRDRAIQAGYDPTIVAYLVGESPRNEQGLYYVTHGNAEIEQAWSNILEGLPYEAFGSRPAYSHPVGSKLTVTKKVLRRHFGESERELSAMARVTRKDVVAFHNRFAALTCFSLMLQTGHRPVRAMFERVTDIDFETGVIFISDKEIRVTNAGRMIPLAPVTMLQIRAWQSHLRNLPAHGGMHLGPIIKASREALDGSGFFMFGISDDSGSISTAPLTPTFLTRQLGSNIWPLQLNWARHVQRRVLSGIRGELIDAWMGHAHPGAELFGPASAANFHDLEELRKAMASILASLGVRVFRGLT